jgi:hypothetical protein
MNLLTGALDAIRARNRDEFGLPPTNDRDAEPEAPPQSSGDPRSDEIEALVYAQREHNRWVGERAKARLDENNRIAEEQASVEAQDQLAREAMFKAEIRAVCEKHGLWLVPYGSDNAIYVSDDAAEGRQQLEDAS